MIIALEIIGAAGALPCVAASLTQVCPRIRYRNGHDPKLPPCVHTMEMN
jgi:hypothetical protein